jgi:hypothetical protein
MIKVLYDPFDFTLIFAMSSILWKHENEVCIVLPIETKNLLSFDLNKIFSMSAILDSENDDFAISSFNLPPDDGQDKLIMLGVHAKNKEEEIILKQFAYDYGEQIMLWVDNNKWNPNLLKFLKQTCSNIIISDKSSCLEKLVNLGYPTYQKWLKADRALENIDLRNDMAKRYIQAMTVNRVIAKNYDNYKDYESRIFMKVVDEILDDEKDYEISSLADLFMDMIVKTTSMRNKFSSKHPIFQKAKKMGRPVGYLNLGKIKSHVDIRDILEFGLRKFPWLCILVCNLNGQKQMYAKSTKIPIRKILSDYKEIDLSHYERLKIMNTELVKYKAKNQKLNPAK